MEIVQRSGVKFGGIFTAELWRPYGKMASESRHIQTLAFKADHFLHRKIAEILGGNLVVNEGLEQALDDLFTGGAQVDPWFCGLTDDSPTPAAGDTLASHGGWVEFDEYTGNRQTYVDVRTARDVTNAASKASFPITGAGGGVGGAFLASVATGSAGVLLCVAALSGGNRAPVSGDMVDLTYVFSGADDGV